MKAYDRIKALEVSTGAVLIGSYDVVYEYDLNQRVTKEIITGAISKTTDFGYDAEDNIVTETITAGALKTTKTYVYDPITKNVTGVHVESIVL